ncbi:hypothetical protein JGU66_14700 [Myxococcaceae bacterium JPH2]|nr:hypothetical protein [Myxococcaceae bacterium JPH2]
MDTLNAVASSSPLPRLTPAQSSEVRELESGLPIPSILDLVLRREQRFHQVLREESALPELLPRMLGLSVLGLATHGAVLGLGARFLPSEYVPTWFQAGVPLAWLPLAFTGAFLGALCVCLPSFYFYTQLSGLDASFRLVTAQALRGQTTASVLLLGALPFYAAWVLGSVLGLPIAPDWVMGMGVVLPFFVGLWGVAAVYRGFVHLAGHLPMTHQRRAGFLRRLVLAWGAVYTAVAPVALWRLGEAFGKWS